MTTHSSVLAWRISWTVEPGELHSMVSQKVGHNLPTKKKSCPYNFFFLLRLLILMVLLASIRPLEGNQKPQTKPVFQNQSFFCFKLKKFLS